MHENQEVNMWRYGHSGPSLIDEWAVETAGHLNCLLRTLKAQHKSFRTISTHSMLFWHQFPCAQSEKEDLYDRRKYYKYYVWLLLNTYPLNFIAARHQQLFFYLFFGCCFWCYLFVQKARNLIIKMRRRTFAWVPKERAPTSEAPAPALLL